MADQESQDFDVHADTKGPSKHVEFEVTDGIARLTLHRAPANVLSIEMMEDLGEKIASLEYRTDVKLLVISGKGKYFSAGFELPDHLGDRCYVMLENFRDILQNLAKVDVPSLAVVAGPALGAGSILAAACDMVMAGAAAKFGHPEIKGGVFNTGAAALLPRLIGRKRALEMILGGGTLTASEAERIGLISRAVPDDKLEAEAAALIHRFQQASAPVLQTTRRAVVGGFDHSFDEAIRHAEDVYLNQLMGTEDAREGLKAVMSKRKPVWKDR